MLQRAARFHKFIRVGVLLHVRDGETDRPYELVFRRGNQVTKEHRLYGGCGLPRGKMEMNDICKVARDPKTVLSIAFKTAANELLEEVGLREHEIEYIGPGPLLVYENSYRIEHYPEWKFKGLGYPVPRIGRHLFEGEPCYEVACIASIFLICSTDRSVFQKYAAAKPEDRIVGTLDTEIKAELGMIRARHLPVVKMYRESLRNGALADGIIDLNAPDD
jgi:hypothetical protein